ncbi:hypothetical protein IFM89_024040 [Coptis chinensis]|uniref:Uncharacterized protein n=1 Tax=Coptis chinensis TaxID=261450 RepID=A0A835HH52_9MAGN|nr:hypothetical protein IFM89_024040 [Coptis chinensis]
MARPHVSIMIFFTTGHGVKTPLSQSFFTYLSLALVYTPILLSQRRKLLVPWYWYALAGFIDVQANYLVIKAYQYSSITSVTLLDCFTIPWVMVLTWIFIGTRYSLGQFFGAALCIGGLSLVVLSDAKESGSGGKNPIVGDLLVIGGTLGYAISNVGEISLFAAFALSTFVFYTIVPLVMKMSGSALFNLSNLTSDMWAVIIRLFFYHQKLDWLYFLSFAVVAVGLVIYSATDEDPGAANDVEVGDPSVQYEVLTEETEHPNGVILTLKGEQLSSNS